MRCSADQATAAGRGEGEGFAGGGEKGGYVARVKNEGFFLGREFCAMVQKIFIYTREEVQKMNPGNALSFSDDKSTPSEDSDLAVDPST